MERKKRGGSITWRWVRGSLLPTILVLLIAESIFGFYIASYYYSGVRTAILTRVNTLNGQLSVLSGEDSSRRNASLRQMAEDFSEKDKFEFMLINTAGRVVSTSSGFVPDYLGEMDDFEQAKRSADGLGEFIGTDAAGERIMAITCLIEEPAGGIMAVRFVTSLTRVDQQIALLILISGIVMLAILFFSVFSGFYFIRSIVLPVNKVDQVARRIAGGDFDARIDNVYNGELGRLCDTINHMAGELAKTDQLKNDFISSVSHELRTPLTSIKGWAETLQRAEEVPQETSKKGLGIITGETDRLYTMVEELLDFSRMQNGGLSLSLELLDLGAELGDVLLMMGQRAQGEGIRFDFTEPETPCPVFADKNRIRQVFVNLLDNALKYSSAGGTIRVALCCAQELALVSIRDEGPGIDREDLQHIKTKFYKGKGAVRGSGIGLAVVDEIVAAHGGTFDIESEPGRGTVVRVGLPMRRPEPKKSESTGEGGPLGPEE